MFREQAATAWLHELRRVAPGADRAPLRWSTELLATDVQSGSLTRLADHVVAIAGVLAEEATCRVAETSSMHQVATSSVRRPSWGRVESEPKVRFAGNPRLGDIQFAG